ncbi:MAG: FAD-dependent oxidoreductase [Thermoplasmatota archaeon]
MRCAVLGAGVSGLSCALVLADAGHEVNVVARERTPATTSDIAAAIYFPYFAEPKERVIGWGRASHARFARLARSTSSRIAGVRMDEVVALERAGEPWWLPMIAGARRATAPETAGADLRGLVAWTGRVPVIEMGLYLPWLEAECERRGVTFERREIRSVTELAEAAPTIVDCTGLGAREIANDASLYPIRGQVARVANPGLTRSILDNESSDAPRYVIPLSTTVVCGGTAEKGEWDATWSEATERAVLAKAASLDARVAGQRVVSRAVGLRPGRPTVRVEAERLASGALVVHDYGHGGAGVTLSWGCAEEVARLVATSP